MTNSRRPFRLLRIMSKKQRKPHEYYWLIGIVLALLFFGLVMILSASSVSAYSGKGDSFYYFKQQLIGSGIGLLCLLIFSRIDYRRWSLVSGIGILLSIALLITVLLWGREAGGSSRWLCFGGVCFQPSEMVKLAWILWAAKILTKKHDDLDDFRELIVPLLPVGGLIMVMILMQPDMGTALIVGLAFFVLLFAAEARLRHLVSLGAAGLVTVLAFILAVPFRRARLLAFLDPWADPLGNGFHIIQSHVAIATGGLTGLRPGRQKYFLPAPFTDFIFSIIGEEWGLIGAFLVIAMFLALAVLGVRTALRSKHTYGRLVAIGITGSLVGQALINMAAVTGLVPVTGVPLPLISFGSSSLVTTLASIGILLNIAAEGGVKLSPVHEDSHKRRRHRRAPVSRPGVGRGLKVNPRGS